MVKIDFAGIKETLDGLDPKKAMKIMTRTINKTTGKADVAARRKIREEYNIKNDRLKDAITISKATYTKPEATIRAKGRVPGMQNFEARQTNQGVTVKVRKSHGRRLIAHAFLATMPNGGVGVFNRTGEGKRIMQKGRYIGKMREPIKRLFGPDVTGMMKVVGVDVIGQTVNDNMEAVFDHELEFEMGKGK